MTAAAKGRYQSVSAFAILAGQPNEMPPTWLEPSEGVTPRNEVVMYPNTNPTTNSISPDYRRGYIAGAVVGATVEDARWAIMCDMNAARVLREDARATGDEALWRNVRYFVAECRMWSQIARHLLRREREALS